MYAVQRNPIHSNTEQCDATESNAWHGMHERLHIRTQVCMRVGGEVCMDVHIMCVRMHVCLYVCTYVCACACIQVWKVRMHVHEFCTYVCMCVCACMGACMYVCMYASSNVMLGNIM